MILTPEVNELIDRAIQEDLNIGDATTDALVPDDLQAKAIIHSRALESFPEPRLVQQCSVGLILFLKWKSF